MKQIMIAGFTLLWCLTASCAVAGTVPILSGVSNLRFTSDMVSGKTMVSSGYTKGSVTFNADGTLTCVDYPSFVKCKSWKIDSDGSILRTFDDTSTGTPTGVKAWWRLLKNNGTSFDVSQTSTNSTGATALTITCR